MKTIYKDKDDLFYVVNISGNDGEVLPVSALDTLSIEVFTQSVDSAVVFDKSDIGYDNVLYISAEKLHDLKPGPVKFRITIGVRNRHYPDGEFHATADKLTGYYLKNQ